MTMSIILVGRVGGMRRGHRRTGPDVAIRTPGGAGHTDMRRWMRCINRVVGSRGIISARRGSWRHAYSSPSWRMR